MVEHYHVALIELTQGQFAVVDFDDYTLVSQHSWYFHRKADGSGYARTGIYNPETQRPDQIFLHHFLLGTKPPTMLDHKNGNKLDCRRTNLRECNNQQNSCNRRKREAGSSQYLGVSFVTRRGKWKAAIKANGRTRFLGEFDVEIDAALAYDAAAVAKSGQFARVNFPTGAHP